MKQDTLKIITEISTFNNFNIHQLDIKAAYLNTSLQENIYMRTPEGTSINLKYCKLNKALYELKQAGRMWNETLNQVLIKIKFKRLISDPCLYIKVNKENKIICILGVYIDDIILFGTDEEIIITKVLL